MFKFPKLIGQELFIYGYLLKDKRLKFTVLVGLIFQISLHGGSTPKNTKIIKTSIFTKFKALACPETKNLVFFLQKKVSIRKICIVKTKAFCLKS